MQLVLQFEEEKEHNLIFTGFLLEMSRVRVIKKFRFQKMCLSLSTSAINFMALAEQFLS